MFILALLERAAKLSKRKIKWIFKQLFLFLETFDGDCNFLYFLQMLFQITDWTNLFTFKIYFFKGIKPAVNY